MRELNIGGCKCLELVGSSRLCPFVCFQGRVRWQWDVLRPSEASGSQRASSETKAAQDTWLREHGSAGVMLVMALCECLRVRVRVLHLFTQACPFCVVSCTFDWISRSCGNRNTRQRQGQKHACCHHLGVCAANHFYVHMPCTCVRVPPLCLLFACAWSSRQRVLHLPTHDCACDFACSWLTCSIAASFPTP